MATSSYDYFINLTVVPEFAYLKAFHSAFENAKMCTTGTLEDLEKIRKTANSNQMGRNWCNGRRFGPNGRPFNKQFYEGLNVQAWPMPANGRKWRRYEPVNHPVQLDPYETLKKAKPIKNEPEDDSSVQTNQTVDPKVTINYNGLPVSG